MILTKVELENIKNYESACFDLDPGVIAICGPNGAGKTTILEAVAWALFDYIPYKKEDFLRRGARRGSVRVSFRSSQDGREYLIYRDTAGGYHAYDPVTKLRLVEQKNQVSSWIKQHLGVDSGTDLKSLFTSAVGVPQGTFTVDFAEQPSKRKMEFDRVLRVDEYQKSSDELLSLVRFGEGRSQVLREDIARTEAQVSQLSEYLDERSRLEARIVELKEALPRAVEARDLVNRELARLDGLVRDIERLDHEIATWAARIREGEARMNSVIPQVEESKTAAVAVEATAGAFAAFNLCSERLSSLDAAVAIRDDIRKRLSDRQRDWDRNHAELQNIADNLSRAQEDRAALESLRPKIARQNALEKRRSELQNARGQQFALKERQSALTKELESLRVEYKDLSAQIEECEKFAADAASWPTLNAERQKVEDELAEWKLESERHAARREDLAKTRETIERLQSQLGALEKDVAAALAVQDTVAGLPILEDERSEVVDEIARIEAAIALDQNILTQVEGGLCPLLSERCKNMKEGQGLDQFFSIRVGSDSQKREQLQVKLASVEQRLSLAREALQAYSALEALEAQRQRYLEELEGHVERAGDLTRALEEFDRGHDREPEMTAKLNDAIARCLKAQDARLKYEALTPLRDRQKQLANRGTEKRQQSKDIDRKMASLAQAAGDLLSVEKELASLQDPRGRCSALEQSIAREKEYREALTRAQTNEAEIKAAISGLEAELGGFSSLDGEIAELRQRRAGLEKDYQTYLANQRIAALLGTRKSELDSVEAALGGARQQHSELGSRLDQARQDYDAELHSNVKRRLEDARTAASSLAFELKAAEDHKAELTMRIDDLMETRQKLASLVVEREQADEVVSTIELVRDLLRRAGPLITEAHLQSISIEANQLYRDISGNPMATIRWDLGYEIILEEGGHERPFLSMSGGEQMVAALAVRMALLKELSDMRIAFFDEPTTNMDEERRRNLAEQIGRIKDFDQLIVISHDDSFEGFTDQIINLGQAGG